MSAEIVSVDMSHKDTPNGFTIKARRRRGWELLQRDDRKLNKAFPCWPRGEAGRGTTKVNSITQEVGHGDKRPDGKTCYAGHW